jgi:hypothetical protein
VLPKKTNLAVAKILNEHLLGPCGIQTLPEYRVSSHDSIWRNTKKVIPVSEWLAVCAFVFDRIDGKPSPAPAANALRGGALLVPEVPGEQFRFTLDFGDAARGPHRRPEANGQPPHAGEALDKERDPS